MTKSLDKVAFVDTAAGYHPDNFLADGGQQWPADVGNVVNIAQDLIRRDMDFSTAVPALTPATLTYPGGVTADHHHDLSIVSGRLRVTGSSGTTQNNLRIAYGDTAAGIMGDSEIKSTLYNTSLDWAVTNTRIQPGHVHRLTRTRQSLFIGVAAAVGASSITAGATTLSVTGGGGGTVTIPAFVAAQLQAGPVAYREIWVQIVDGPGTGQKRRVINQQSGTPAQLNVDHAWTTTGDTVIPTTASTFEVYTYDVRALSVVWGIVAGHEYIQPNIWDNDSYRQPDIGQVNLGAYTRPLGGFGSFKPFPWNLKTRVEGNVVDMAVWVAGDSEPDYGTSGQSVTWILGAGNDYGYADEPGLSGFYFAHMNAGDWAELGAFATIRL